MVSFLWYGGASCILNQHASPGFRMNPYNDRHFFFWITSVEGWALTMVAFWFIISYDSSNFTISSDLSNFTISYDSSNFPFSYDSSNFTISYDDLNFIIFIMTNQTPAMAIPTTHQQNNFFFYHRSNFITLTRVQTKVHLISFPSYLICLTRFFFFYLRWPNQHKIEGSLQQYSTVLRSLQWPPGKKKEENEQQKKKKKETKKAGGKNPSCGESFVLSTQIKNSRK